WDQRVQINARTARTRPHKSVHIRKVAIVRRSYDLTSVANAFSRRIDELASAVENDRRAATPGPKHSARLREVRVIGETNHAARVVQSRGDHSLGAKPKIRINEFPAGRSQRYRGTRATCPERGMAFNEVCIAAGSEDVAGSIHAQRPADRKLVAQPGKINGRRVAVWPKDRLLH